MDVKPVRYFIAIFILALSIGCTGNGKNADGVSFYVEDDSVMMAGGYDIVPLHKTKTGHITATINVNGKPCEFLVDTGGGGTLIDISKKEKYGLEALGKLDYAAGFGSVSSLVRTSAILQVNGKEFKSDNLFLMDISYLNAEFKKTKGKQVDGVLGTDFLEKHKAIIDYPHSKLYLIIEPDGENQVHHRPHHLPEPGERLFRPSGIRQGFS